MDPILLRPIFRAKYIAEQKNKNKFNQGGLASIKKYATGGLSEGEKTAITLAPFVKALTGAQTKPGESDMSGFARAFGEGLGGLGEAKKTIAAIETATTKSGKGPYRLLTREEVIGTPSIMDKSRTYQVDLSTGKIEPFSGQGQTINIGDKATEYQKKKASKDADYTSKVETAAVDSAKNLEDIKTMKFLASNPDLTFGQFGEFAQSAERLARGFGLTIGQDQSAGELFTKLGGQQVLAGLSNFKGAISNAEREYVASLMPQLSRSREGVQAMLRLQEKLEDRNIKMNDFMQKWLTQNDPDAKGPSFAKDANGDNFYTAQAKFLNANPIFDKGFQNEIVVLSKKVDPQFSKDLVRDTKTNELFIKKTDGTYVPYKIKMKPMYNF